MAIKLNFNICDNAPECSGIAVCPTGAIYWDEETINPLNEKGSICVDNGKCIACKKCVGENGCPIGAIIFADSEDELENLTRDYETDLIKVKNLFVERFGAAPIDDSLCIKQNELNTIIESNRGILVIEKFADWSIQCLLSAIPIDTIIEEIKTITKIDEIKYFRVDMTETVDEEMELPELNIYKANTLLCKICGFMNNTQIDEMKNMLQRSLK